MSSLYVRTKVRDWCAGLTLPFYDTVNVNQPDPPHPAWLTVQFVTASNSQLDFCNGMWERGTFDLIVLTKGNTSDVVLAQAEADLKTFMAQRDRRLALITASPFEDFFQPAVARWFTLSSAVDYQFMHH
ncbi:hypothetical protein VAR608DRAFT_4874 [Variovorax sp. HW608]|uniref:hypothetical protein n=1 Tax=Variovorax sp. HW608 TaxID=1034889 RepID=UPI00081FE484|nr:hypothetical protein [Variovorax sp. HW608]SCK49037.1 hypothetical protein VAR608DRAFT_4874 [Variovorax sp. HW608]